MSDKLNDEQILKLAEKHHALHPGVDEWWEFRGREDLLAFAHELLAASPAPAIPAEVATPESLSDKGSEAIPGAQVADQNAPAICVGCEGKPAAGNDPCAICGRSSAPAISESEDAKRLDFIAAESVDLVSFAIQYEDDADIGWRVLQQHIGEAEPRVIGEVFEDDPRAAIDAARKGEKS
ncbi:hypothetical protein [Burkholderia glumae]|uniref:hypothetical protein n=1 Tax=Burkholderia glumae TaxID=337 RepID=UPI00214FE2E7|nr:hypothetical protein [Burkholderia glumae]